MVVKTKVKEIWYCLVFYLGEPQTSCKCIEFLISQKSLYEQIDDFGISGFLGESENIDIYGWNGCLCAYRSPQVLDEIG